MTTAAISKLIESYLTELEGRSGFWRGLREQVPVYVFCDDKNDRMRLMAPVGELRELDPAVLQVLLQANYDRALDAKYALRGLEVWAVSVHPLATLAPDDFASFIEQVVKLVKNTGSTYASSDLVFLASGEEGEAGESGDGPSEGEGPEDGSGENGDDDESGEREE
ncbi:MAG: type III secretion system chaperone [Candidatus Eiseniibacteriota bacterium]